MFGGIRYKHLKYRMSEAGPLYTKNAALFTASVFAAGCALRGLTLRAHALVQILTPFGYNRTQLNNLFIARPLSRICTFENTNTARVRYKYCNLHCHVTIRPLKQTNAKEVVLRTK